MIWPVAAAGCSLLTDLSGLSGRARADGGDSDFHADSGSASDALLSGEADAAPQDAGRCDRTKAFGVPVPLGTLNLPDENDRAARLTPDELTIYFSSARSSSHRIYRATRARVDDAFGAPALLDELTTPSYDFLAASPRADGLELIIEARGLDGGTGGTDLLRLTRATTGAPFANAVDIGSVNTGVNETDPHLGGAGLELWFARTATDGIDLFVASRATLTADFGSPSQLAGPVNSSSGADTDPVPSADGTELFFQSDRLGSARIWVARRGSPTEAFGAPVHVTELDGPGLSDVPNWLSPDGCVLYMTSYSGSGLADLVVATRPR
jgi:hypothetical protein